MSIVEFGTAVSATSSVSTEAVTNDELARILAMSLEDKQKLVLANVDDPVFVWFASLTVEQRFGIINLLRIIQCPIK